jgi:hypothetical protein
MLVDLKMEVLYHLPYSHRWMVKTPVLLASLYPLNQEEGLEDGNQESTCLSNKDPK